MAYAQSKLPFALGENYLFPRDAVQCAMFSSLIYRGQVERPAYTKPVRLFAHGHVDVYQTAGEQLDQSDADVVGMLVRLAMEQPAATELVELQFGADEMLNALDWKRGTGSRVRLEASIQRLTRAAFLFDVPGIQECESHFIQSYHGDKRASLNQREKDELAKTGNRISKSANVPHAYTVRLDPRMGVVFNKGQTLVRSAERNALDGHLAKALHLLYSSHKKPDPMHHGFLQKIMHRETMEDRKWLAALDKALAELTEKTSMQCSRNGTTVTILRPARMPKAQTQAIINKRDGNESLIMKVGLTNDEWLGIKKPLTKAERIKADRLWHSEQVAKSEHNCHGSPQWRHPRSA